MKGAALASHTCVQDIPFLEQIKLVFRISNYCVLNGSGNIVQVTTIQSTHVYTTILQHVNVILAGNVLHLSGCQREGRYSKVCCKINIYRLGHLRVSPVKENMPI